MENTPKNKPTSNLKPEEKMKGGLDELFSGILEFLNDLFDLRPGLDKAGTIKSIKENKRMRGANAWLLICSIIVASIGLDLNSQAVIIGAMLISPLMSPILGVGLAVGINDREMFKISAKHFAISIIIALLTSTFYFSITPLGALTEQIDARTAPTLLDVMIAFFGGVAGIVSGSRKDKSNAIPGVAIATALMPPLCVTGYGVANLDIEIILKSFYLFFLNAVFVALATYMVVRLLRFPKQIHSNEGERDRTKQLLGLFSALLIIPSIFIFMGVIQDVRETNKLSVFLKNNFENAYWDIDKDRDEFDSLTVRLVLPGEYTDEQLEGIQTNFQELSCKARLNIIRSSLPSEEFNQEEFKSSIKNEMIDLMESSKKVTKQKDKEIVALAAELDSLKSQQLLFDHVSREAKALYPLLEEISYAPMQKSDFDTTLLSHPTFLLKWSNRKKVSSKRRDEKKMYDWLKIRADLDTLQIISR